VSLTLLACLCLAGLPATNIICGHCAAHGQQRQALLLDLRKAVADVKTALQWTPPQKDKSYQTMAHTNTCRAYAEAVLAPRGLDSRRSGWTETDDEWAALAQLLARRALQPGVTEHLTHPRTLREYSKRVTQALVKAQHTAAMMVYARHSSRHKHLLLHRQQAEEEATAVHKQRVANKTEYQAVAGVLMRLQRQVRASVPQWRATREANAAAAEERKRRAAAGYRQTRSMTARTSRAKNGRAGGNSVGGGSASGGVEGRGVVGGGGGGDSGGGGDGGDGDGGNVEGGGERSGDSGGVDGGSDGGDGNDGDGDGGDSADGGGGVGGGGDGDGADGGLDGDSVASGGGVGGGGAGDGAKGGGGGGGGGDGDGGVDGDGDGDGGAYGGGRDGDDGGGGDDDSGVKGRRWWPRWKRRRRRRRR